MEYLESLEASHQLRDMKNLNTVFHFTPLSVFTDPRYSQFLSSLGPEVSHVMLNESTNPFLKCGLCDYLVYQI